MTKVYLNFADSTSESIGWTEIGQFVRNFMAAHPEPEPAPTPLTDAEGRVYGTAARVTYEQLDARRGRKRETRLLEKYDGQWCIAGMQTTIYAPPAQ